MGKVLLDRNTKLSNENTEAFGRLYQLLHGSATNVLAVVGAGVSIRAGYRSWSDLLTVMADRIVSLNSQFEDTVTKLSGSPEVIWRAEEYRQLLTEDRYQDLLRTVFGPPVPKPVDVCIENLIALKFRHVLTTNYDKVLEVAHFQRNQQVPDCPVPKGQANLMIRKKGFGVVSPQRVTFNLQPL